MTISDKGNGFSRRSFLWASVAAAGTVGLHVKGHGQNPEISGFEKTESTLQEGAVWTPKSDRKIRMGIVGYGVCRFGAAFYLQDHPNVEIVAVSDLLPDRCAALAKACRCEKTYPSLEEMLKDDTIEAVFIATDAPSHAWHCIDTLRHGKHVACAVPAVFGSLEEADQLLETVKETGLTYMMFETSAYHDEAYAMRELYKAGKLGPMVYTEGEYFHYMDTPIDSFRGWRIGLPPQWYPTHSNGYYTCVTGGSFTEVSCMAYPSEMPDFQPKNNRYQNPFSTEIALFRTSEGGMARMAVSWETPGYQGEMGRVRGTKGSVTGVQYEGIEDISGIELNKPPLPPTVKAGGHGGSHGYLGDEYVNAILEERLPLVDIITALNTTVSGVVAHQSALQGGALLKIPQYSW
ncbi:MAG: Gfo/Idh/MocA family protein [Candidatus Hydrogenedentales bacterium]|jgi:predicted dehydrogenase